MSSSSALAPSSEDSSSTSPLPSACVKELGSKEPERRAAAAREVGKLTYEILSSKGKQHYGQVG